MHSEQRQNKANSKGFTLIEVLIVTAIIGILSAIMYPNYRQYVTEVRRGDGQLALLDAVQSLERCKASNYSYATCTLSASQLVSPEGYYELTLESTASTYTVSAAAVGSQVFDTECTPMTLNNQGTRTPIAPATCWPD